MDFENNLKENKILYMSMLFDFYSDLLTSKQKYIFEMYFLENYSMQEIAQELLVSRQTINDTLKKVEVILKGYECKLTLIENHYTKINKLNQIDSLITDVLEKESKDCLVKDNLLEIKNIIEKMINE